MKASVQVTFTLIVSSDKRHPWWAIFETAVVLGHITVSHEVGTSLSWRLNWEWWLVVSLWSQRKDKLNARAGTVTAVHTLWLFQISTLSAGEQTVCTLLHETIYVTEYKDGNRILLVQCEVVHTWIYPVLVLWCKQSATYWRLETAPEQMRCCGQIVVEICFKVAQFSLDSCVWSILWCVFRVTLFSHQTCYSPDFTAHKPESFTVFLINWNSLCHKQPD